MQKAQKRRIMIEMPVFYKLHEDEDFTVKRIPGKRLVEGAYKVYYPEMVDFERYREDLRRKLELEPDGLVVAHDNCGPSTLMVKEHLKLIDYAVKAANGRCKIIASVGSNATNTAMEFGLAAKDIGADELMYSLPYYNRPTEEGVIRHMKMIRRVVTDIPIWICINPGRSNVKLSINGIKEMAEEGYINAVLLESSDGLNARELNRANIKDLKIFCVDSLMQSLFGFNMSGVVSSIANFDFGRVKAIIDAINAGDEANARLAQGMIHIMTSTMQIASSPMPLMTIMSQLDQTVHNLQRLPLCTLPSEKAKGLKEMLQYYEILE